MKDKKDKTTENDVLVLGRDGRQVFEAVYSTACKTATTQEHEVIGKPKLQ